MERASDDYPGMSDRARACVDAVLAARPRALLSDIDGTISAIAPTPDAAVLLPGVRELLRRARAVFDVVAVVSGRTAADARRLVGLPELDYLGNHGLEQLGAADGPPEERGYHVVAAAEPYVPRVAATLDAVERTLAPRFPGILVERKGVTGSIHVRLAPDPQAAATAVAQVLATLPAAQGLRITHGKQVLEVRPPLDAHKGTAIAALIRARGIRGAIYFGDDYTDMDAFRALHHLSASGRVHCCSVAVLQTEAPADLARAADFALEQIAQVPALLAWLLARAHAR